LEQKSPNLAEVQRWMRWVITEPRGIHEALAHPWTLDASLAKRYKEPKRQFEIIEEAAPLSKQDRLNVYANAYFYRLLESLGVDYATVRRVVGDENFHDLIAHFLMRYPSNSPNIGDVGETFPAFINGHPLSAQFPFLHELAVLERAIMECLFTHHLPALDVSSFQTKSEEDWAIARFVLDPTVRLMSAQWPVDLLWKRREQSEPLELPALMESTPRNLLLYRDDSWVNVSVIDVHSWMALRMLQDGLPLGAVCEALSKQWDERTEPLPVMEWFSSWVAAGLVRNILWND